MVALAIDASDELDLFYAKIREPIEVAVHLRDYEQIFSFIHQTAHTPDYRAARGRLKRLRDEVTPIVGLLKRQAKPVDSVKFNLDSSDHDALWVRSGSYIKIDATVAQARARLNLVRELNQSGRGRGFLPITDDDKTERFIAAMEEEPQAYSTDEYVSTLDKAIRLCLQQKRLSSADILVIDAPVSSEYMRFEPVRQIPVLSEPNPLAKCAEVYVIDREVCLQISGR